MVVDQTHLQKKASFKLTQKILTARNTKQLVGGTFCDL